MAKVDYLTILEAAWQQHLAPRAEDAPTVISLFAGCGGSSLGYSMAGFRELLAVEWDKNACATFRLNFPDVPVYEGDIAQLSVEKCLDLTGLEPGQLDVLDGSPPCQGFSTAGKRELEDVRNGLSWEFIRLLRGLQPRAFVMENVSGMVKGKMKLVFADVMRGLKASGYQVRCKLLNAMYFQVPQSRARLIWLGLREDQHTKPSYPSPQALPIGIGTILPGISASRSMKINPWIRHPRPAATLTKTYGDYQLLDAGFPRKLTIAESKLLSGWPDVFAWASDIRAGMGNSVPPLFMRAIAGHVAGLLRLTGMGLEPKIVGTI